MRLIAWLENNMLPCPYNKYLGLDCLGCGIQRAAIALLKGNVTESFYLYPALIPILLMLLLLSAHVIFKFKNGGTWLKYNFIFVVALVVVNFVFKLI